RLTVGDTVKFVDTRVLVLVESQIPQFHGSLPALTIAGGPCRHGRSRKLFSDGRGCAVRGGQIALGSVVSFVVVARAIVDEDRLAVFAEDRQAIFAKYGFAFLRTGRIQFALRPFGSLVALLLHAGDFLLPFLK